MRDGTDPDGAARQDASLPLVERLLASRGMVDPAEVDRFRAPTLHHLHPPALLPHVDDAVECILDALRAEKTIVIYGDYDVDGITAASILYHTIRAIRPDARVRTFVPHRLEDGYGLSAEALTRLRDEGADLVISVDCGITAVGPAEAARACGLDLIITDHHNPPPPGAPLPPARAILHPRLPGCEYPFGELCGAGVAFKLAWRLATAHAGSDRVGRDLQQMLLDLLPLAALATIADVVPLVGENRVLASQGLRLIKQTPFPGLRALIEATGLMDAKIDCEKVGFILGPHLNACGRMGHAREAVHMLTAASEDEAIRIARDLARLNRERRETERAIHERAAAMAEDLGMTADDRRIIILAEESWHPGVVGIVCSRLTERFSRPTILMQRANGMCKGSARSIEGYSIASALASCAELLTTHGGHDMAAGLSLPTDRLEPFVEAMTAHANANIAETQLTPCLTIDCDASLQELSLEAVADVRRLSPFGRGNPKPLVRLRNVVVAGPPRQMGGQGRHLSVLISQHHAGQRRQIRTVWWSHGWFAGDLAKGQPLDVVIEPKLNTWNGRTTVEGVIRDVRLLKPTAAKQ